VFTVEERDRVRKRLLALAETDQNVPAAAITGSYVHGASDEWSDVDLAFAIRGDVAPALERWTEVLYRDFAAIHHWDLPWGSTIYRVFLLPDWLQVDISFTPAADFGPRGPNWRTVFGETVEIPPNAPVSHEELVGWAWVYARHAHTCIERRKPWQAEWSISGIRDNVLALASLRFGYITRYAKGADLLPAELTAPLEATLVRSLDEAELRRALAAAADALADELDRTDPQLSKTLRPMLRELVSAGDERLAGPLER
jgi:predicted nucleotidyltransferase